MNKQLSFLRNQRLLTIAVSETISNIGNWITMMAIYSLVIFKGNGNALQSSLIHLAGLLPILFFSPAAGWLADRFDRKWLMVLSEVCAGLSIAGLIFASRLEIIYLLVALQAVFISLMTPTRRAVIPSIIPAEQLAKANAFLEQLSGLIKIFAPVLAGMVLTVMNPHQAIILDVVSFALSAFVLSRLPSLPPAKVEQAANQPEQHKKSSAGLSSILKSFPQLGLLYGCTFASIMIIVGFDVLAAVYTRDILLGDERLFSMLIASVGAGTLAGTLFLMMAKSALPAWRGFFLGLFLLALIPLVLALSAWITPVWASWAVAVAGCFLGGIGNGWLHVHAATLMQTLSPRQFLGRVGGIFESVATSGQLAGVLLSPLLVPAVLPITSLFLLDFLFLALLAIFSSMRLRSIQRPTLSYKPGG